MSTATLWSASISASRPVAERIADALDSIPEPAPISVAFHEDNSPDCWTVTAHYTDRPNLNLLKVNLADQNLPSELQIQPLPDVDWVAKSLEHLSPITTDRFFVAGSHQIGDRPSGKLALLIDAGQAFGTGHHETTLGCLIRLETILKPNRNLKILDLGTGTGVLALAAAKLARRQVFASDIDPIATNVAKANAAQNNLAPWIRLTTATGFQSTLLKQNAPYDLIIANILARPLVRLAPAMHKNTANGGTVLLSGLLARQERLVLSAYLTAGFRFENRLQIGDWTTLELCR